MTMQVCKLASRSWISHYGGDSTSMFWPLLTEDETFWLSLCVCECWCSKVQRSCEALQDPPGGWEVSSGARRLLLVTDRPGGALLHQHPEQCRHAGKSLQEGETGCAVAFSFPVPNFLLFNCKQEVFALWHLWCCMSMCVCIGVFLYLTSPA